MVRMRAGLLCMTLVGCAQSHPVGEEATALSRAGRAILAGCETELEVAEERGSVPKNLGCTGLYEDRDYGEIAEDARPFEPTYKLWSDDSLKSRWFSLPEGETIDTSNFAEWKFPIGTKFWKEFRRGDRKVETRLFQKLEERRWVHGTYVWNDEQDEAEVLTTGMTVEVEGVEHDVPTHKQCTQCHSGHDDRVLGFEAVSLGLPNENPEALTLQQLVDEGLLSDPPERTTLQIGPDGTNAAAQALGWLHVNCGVACHNQNANAEARKTKMVLKLDANLLDGRPLTELATLATTIDQPAQTQQWIGQQRIVPGKPDDSLLIQLAESRVPEGGNRQMPPVGTRLVDQINVDKIRTWISSLEPAIGPE
jgi:hypothetical protein